MRISATGSSRHSGFTLLEMLVALAILAIALASASLALNPDSGRQLEQEAERIALLLEQAREESLLAGQPLAWVAYEDRYEFQRRELLRDGPRWQVVRGDELLRPRQLPPGMMLRRIEVNGVPLPFGTRIDLGQPLLEPLHVELAAGPARTRVLADAQGYRVQSLVADRP